eukprot:scaffold3162_cov74-Skeletonema_dohrnii-CCMP3373.AAC.1
MAARTGWVSQLASRQNMLPAGRKPIFVSARCHSRCAALFIRHDTLFIRLTRCVTPRRRKIGFLPAGSIFWREASCDTHPVRDGRQAQR